MFEDSIDKETASIELYDSQGQISVNLQENGQIQVAPENTFSIPEAFDDFRAVLEDGEHFPVRDVTGELEDGTPITLHNARIGMKLQGMTPDGTQVKEITPQRVTINSQGQKPILDGRVTVEIDLLNAKHITPYASQPPDLPILERESWLVRSFPVQDQRDRIDLIKEYRRPLRTSKLVVEQTEDYPPHIQVQTALQRIKPLLWLFSVLQGVFPSPLRAKITEVDGEPVEWRYESWISDWKRNIGSAHIGPRLEFGDDSRVFFDDGYDTYLNELDETTFNRTISWYLDALVQGRSVDARLASISAGIEQLAEGHRSRDRESGNNASKVKNLINKLGVEFEDLAVFSGTFPDDAIDGSYPDLTPEYFYSKSRNYTLHGEEKVDSAELIRDYEAALWLFRRILVRQFVDDENFDDLHKLNDLGPDDDSFTSVD